ncbi:ribonuclease III [Mageeibacillus indolicus UPII9-5]|uniref:Ribonuclease 3 n=1 Tax=Mageeibacillus indolicus (strain UPII9-5) TaxID=699246 RepID=D3R1A9_MAGIU|nr:ribonuclease III [Mageeibacillus indolicus]ADC91338.1 ribonuclease III [Mageeibacillus indolicus UPII9-5]
MKTHWQPSKDWLEQICNFENKIGYSFKNKKYLIEALTHSTYSYEHSMYGLECNERLEFLGDLVLGLTVGNHLFKTFPTYPEGKLSKLKAALVCEPTLAIVAHNWELDKVLLLGKGEETSGGRNKPSSLADATEAVLGAVFCDADFVAAATVILRALEPLIQEAVAGNLVYDYKSALLEKIQTKYHSSQLRFVLLDETGPAHSPSFKMGIYLVNDLLATAIGSSKKEAEQIAAKQALQLLDMKKCI